MKQKPPIYSANALLASAVLYFAVRQSAGNRGAIDWIVITLISGATLYNLIQLGRRLHRAGGARDVWHLQRTVLFWIIAVFNTVLIREEDVGGWRHFVGIAFAVIAVFDTVAVSRKERRSMARS